MAATAAQIQQALFTGCGMCGGAFCQHGICRVCGTCLLCDVSEKPAPRDQRHEMRQAETANLHEKAEQRRRDVNQALAELASCSCACSRRKREQQSFCKACYISLPKEIRAGLYLHISSGYLEFWREAKEALRASGRISAQEEAR